MADQLSSYDLKEACKAVNAEMLLEDLNFFMQQTKGTETMHALSPEGEDNEYFLDTTNKPYILVDQGSTSKAFTDNDWQPPVQNTQSNQQETSSVDNCSIEEWKKDLRISVRDQNTSLQELGIHLVSSNLPKPTQVDQSTSQFITGKVSYTKTECLPEFLNQLQPSSDTQGCVLKKELSIEDGQYSEEKHFSHENGHYRGAFGKVDKCWDFVSGYEFVRKTIAMDKFRPSEVLLLLTLKHANIMKICGVIQRVEVDGGNVMEILMENAGISLAEFVKNLPESETPSQMLIWDLTKQALEGLAALHRERIIHLDIKPENLCIQEDNRGSYALTITDFGSAMKVNQEMDFVGWTPEYLAPELCRYYLKHTLNNGMFSNMNDQITGKVDVFALGLTVLFLHQKKHVLLNLLTEGQNSYNGLPMEKKILLQLQLLLYLATEKDPVSHLISDKCCIYMRDIMLKMLSGPAEDRPTSEKALKCMKLTENEVDQIISQPSASKPHCLAFKTRNRPIDSQSYQFTIDQGQLVTQTSCSSSVYTPKKVRVPVRQLYLPISLSCETGPIKDHMVKQKLREKLKPYLKGKILVQKEIEVKMETSNPTPMNNRNLCWSSMQSPASVAMTTKQIIAMDNCIKENGVMETGYNIKQHQFLEELGVTLIPQLQDTKPIQPPSHNEQESNVVVLCGNIPDFEAIVSI